MLCKYIAVEARNLAPLPMDIDHVVAAALPISGLSAWQGLFDHGRLTTGQTVLIHGAAGGVGSIAVQLACEVGARVIGTGRAADRGWAGELGVHTFLDLETEKLEDAGEVDVVFDVIGGDILARSAALVRGGGTLVTIAEPPLTLPRDGRALFFVVEADRARLADLAARVRDGRLKPVVGAVLPLAEAAAAFAPDKRIPGKTILRVTERLKQTELRVHVMCVRGLALVARWHELGGVVVADPAQHLDRWAPETSAGPVMSVASRNATVRVDAWHWIPEDAASVFAVDIVHFQRW